MSDITISVPDEWADLVRPFSVRSAKLRILQDAIEESAGEIHGLVELNWQDDVREPIPRLEREVERLRALTGAVVELQKEEEAAMAALDARVTKFTAIEGGK